MGVLGEKRTHIWYIAILGHTVTRSDLLVVCEMPMHQMI